jgi:hypothetical protein
MANDPMFGPFWIPNLNAPTASAGHVRATCNLPRVAGAVQPIESTISNLVFAQGLWRPTFDVTTRFAARGTNQGKIDFPIFFCDGVEGICRQTQVRGAVDRSSSAVSEAQK